MRAIVVVCGEELRSFLKYGSNIPVCSALGLPRLAGIYRRPVFMCPDYLSSNILHLLRATGPCSSTRALSNLDIQMPTRPLWNVPQAVEAITVNRRGPTAVPRTSELRELTWTRAEQDMIQAQPARAQHRVMTILRHNRTAFEEGKHVFLLPPGDAKTSSLLQCQHCEYQPKLALLHQSLDQACHRMPGSRKETSALIVRNTCIKEHNLTAKERGLHVLKVIDTVQEENYICLTCATTSPITKRSSQGFRRQRCTARDSAAGRQGGEVQS